MFAKPPDQARDAEATRADRGTGTTSADPSALRPSIGDDIGLLQQTIGNRGVQRLIARRELARQTRHRHPRRTAAGATNAVKPLVDASLEDLLALYVSTADVHFLDAEHDYTASWLANEGEEIVRRTIERRLSAMAERGERADLRSSLRQVMGLEGHFLRKVRLLGSISAALQAVRRPLPRTLGDQERSDLERLTGNAITRAFAAFLTACEQHKDALRAEARASAEILTALIDIATGFLGPVFIGAGARLVRLLPLTAHASPEYLQLIRYLSTADVAKATFGALTKAANVGIKIRSMPLFGESDIDAFLTELEVSMQREAHNLDERIPHLSDAELVLLAGVYHPDAANLRAYRERVGDLISKFRREVRPIREEPESYDYSIPRVYWYGGARLYEIRQGPTTRLALVGYSRMPLSAPGDLEFKSWISPELEEMARAASIARFGAITTIDADRVEGVPAAR